MEEGHVAWSLPTVQRKPRLRQLQQAPGWAGASFWKGRSEHEPQPKSGPQVRGPGAWTVEAPVPLPGTYNKPGSGPINLRRSSRAPRRPSFGQRRALQGKPTRWLPKGSVGEAIRRRGGIDEACSSCDERVNSYGPEVRRRALRRFSGAELKERVREARAAQALRVAAKAKAVAVEEEEEEEEEESSPEVEFVYDDNRYRTLILQAARTMEQDPQQLLSQQLAETMQVVRNLQGRIESQEQELQGLRAERAQTRRLSLDSNLELTPASTPGLLSNAGRAQEVPDQPRGLVHARQLGKPDKFSGEPSKFEDWSFILEAYMCCVI